MLYFASALFPTTGQRFTFARVIPYTAASVYLVANGRSIKYPRGGWVFISRCVVPSFSMGRLDSGGSSLPIRYSGDAREIISLSPEIDNLTGASRGNSRKRKQARARSRIP